MPTNRFRPEPTPLPPEPPKEPGDAVGLSLLLGFIAMALFALWWALHGGVR